MMLSRWRPSAPDPTAVTAAIAHISATSAAKPSASRRPTDGFKRSIDMRVLLVVKEYRPIDPPLEKRPQADRRRERLVTRFLQFVAARCCSRGPAPTVHLNAEHTCAAT